MLKDIYENYLRTGQVLPFFDYEFSANWQQELEDVSNLKKITNSSVILKSNSGKKYQFSDNFYEISTIIEDKIRGEGRHIYLSSSVHSNYSPYDFRVIDNERINNVIFNPNYDPSIIKLADYISQFEKPNLIANSFVWLALTTNPLKNLLKATWTNIDYDLFAKGQFNDQMIDWNTGGNFYTCSHNQKHFLPIFLIKDGKSNNLLNLADGFVECDDKWTFKERVLCSCGKYRIDFDFISHQSINLLIDRQIINQLKSNYANLQFYECEPNRLRIFFSVNGEFMDEDILNKLGNVIFYKDLSFYYGRKHYNFLKNANPYILPIKPISISKIF